MEPTEVKKKARGRPRKRRRGEDEPEKEKKVDMVALKKQALEMRWKPIVGRYVLKEFDDTGVFLGKVVSYDSGLYRVEYEDGDCEDMDSREVRPLLLGDEYLDDDLSARGKKLDQILFEKTMKHKKGVEKEKEKEKGATDLKNEVERFETSALTELSGGAVGENGGVESESDADSSSDSCEQVQHGDLEMKVDVPIVPPLELPPSSGNIGVPEECVSHLFSVYGFLRSFNICLFLSPFTLDSLVGAINCKVQNTLLDAIHVALMRVLRGHLQILSSDGSELASKCLRCIDWSLLDSHTWPVYLVHYFTIMGYVDRPEWKGFYDDLFKKEYYSLPVSKKLMILQILCDDALDCRELRAEIDAREESEVGIDPDAVPVNPCENGPRRVHPRYSKTSACKDREAMEINAEAQGTKSSCGSKNLGSKGREGEGIPPDVGVDGNSDECRLCGMDGTLLCCDGCPSAYHSRCIGVSKMYIPDGPWYCPECTINKLGPANVVGTSLEGAKVFGVDLYEQVFLGTCNHLLVLNSSSGTEPCLRYYNQMDILKVLQVLSSSVQHRSFYFGICKAIGDYWKIPESAFSPVELMGRGLCMSSLKDENPSSFSMPSICNLKDTCAGEAETANSRNVNNVDDLPVSCPDASVSATIQADPSGTLNNDDATNTQSCHIMNVKLPEQIKVESTGSINQQIDPSDVSHHSSVDRSSVTTTCASANSGRYHIVQESAKFTPAIPMSQSKVDNNLVFGRTHKSLKANFMCMGTLFKPFSYINHYVHGDFSASAAASLGVLLSEESRVSESQRSGSAKKGVSYISLQIKAFSTIASRFFWPSSEKKLIEVPRERCGWCHSCKLASTTKRGCMLNSAVSIATKGAIKILSGLRPLTSDEGSLASISTYILYMGEVLCGLTVGPFASPSYRKQWCKRVEDASTIGALKGPLLELEKNMRGVSLSSEWAKATDEWLDDSPAIVSAASNVGTTQKRGPGGKRHRKQSGISDMSAKSSNERSFVWWRGGKLLKLVFHKAILPQLVVKRAARQGGSRKISGICYADDPVHPKRSRQVAWRAAVERSKNASQLALQVRYLDLHVRWSDLVRPEQNLQDGKGPETEASCFRNAVICDKKILENRIRYGVAFGNQKHLPSRIMKNIIEKEEIEGGDEKYWFSETYVPLYLIKEYEEKVEKVEEAILPSDKKPLSQLSELQRRQLKAARKDIFLFLSYKRDNLERCLCTSCHSDVLLRDTVKCCVCQGYCHKDCTVNLDRTNVQVQFTCKKCYKPKVVLLAKNESPTTPLALEGRESHTVSTITKKIRFKLSKPLIPEKAPETSSEIKKVTFLQKTSSEIKQATPASSLVTKPPKKTSSEIEQATPASSSASKPRKKICSWGVIWKKKPLDTGIEFRSRNIIFRGESWRIQPPCNLCKKAYNSQLSYIHCESCDFWFHTAAVELPEDKIPEVVGFKCCRCRRIRSPICPYDDNPQPQRPLITRKNEKKGKTRVKSDPGLIPGFIESRPSPDSGMISEFSECRPSPDSSMIPEFKECIPSPRMHHVEEVIVREDDPLLFSLSRVEQLAEENPKVEIEWDDGLAQGPHKLPVRRHGKPLINTESTFENDDHAEPLVPSDGNYHINHKEELYSPFEWDASTNVIESEGLMDYDINYEDMEFEPQTYFSFTELLDTDNGQPEGVDASGNTLGYSESKPSVSQDGLFTDFQDYDNGGQLEGFDASLDVLGYSASKPSVSQDGLFTDLLDSDNGNQLEGFDASVNVLGYPESKPLVSQEGFPEQPTRISNSLSEPLVTPKFCKFCLHSEPVPDLSCGNCNVLIHSHCSPWTESSSLEVSWRCGNCREWR
ncbi:metalloendopeptidases zinc ion binding DNA binding [Euphorbia peplus]|nr:metalloendopeptidases zinc ion binding DNA binding [Euphorbia peplus]